MRLNPLIVRDIIVRINDSEFNSWFWPSEVMATVEVESAFNPNAYRKEPSGVASYGLMQVLDVTAKTYGIHDAALMYEPQQSLRIGMHVMFDNWNLLTKRLGSEPSYDQWSAAYNEGAGNVLRGLPDSGYTTKWAEAQAHWHAQLNEGS